jgi:hypothetical protein
MSILDLGILLLLGIFRPPLQPIWLETGKERGRGIVKGKEIVNVKGRGKENENERGREIEID